MIAPPRKKAVGGSGKQHADACCASRLPSCTSPEESAIPRGHFPNLIPASGPRAPLRFRQPAALPRGAPRREPFLQPGMHIAQFPKEKKTITLASPRRDVAPAPSPQNENSASASRKTHFGPRVPKLGFVVRIWPSYAERLDLRHFPRQRFPGAPEVFNFRKCRDRDLGRGSPGALRRDWILSRKGRLRSSMHSVTPDRSRAKNKSARHRVAAAR